MTMWIEREKVIEAVNEMGAGGSTAATVDVVWGHLNLPQDGNLIKVGGEIDDKMTSSSKGIKVTVTVMETLENMRALLAMKAANCEVAIISQETEVGDHPNQGELDLDGEGDEGDEAEAGEDESVEIET